MSAHDRLLLQWSIVGICAACAAAAVTAVSPREMAELPAGMRAPVVALELARTRDEVEAMFGAAGSPERETWRARMQLGVWLDYALLLAYGVFLAGVAHALTPYGRPAAHRSALVLALAAAGFDALENSELTIVLQHLGADYRDALARLGWFTWLKWLALAAYFALLAPALWRASAVLRVAAVVGAAATVSTLGALFVRGPAADAMGIATALAIALLIVASFLRLRAPRPR